MLVDTHAHLDDERFQSDLAEVVQRSESAGLERVIVVATKADTSRRCCEIARAFPNILRATVGIQPNHVAQEPADAWDRVVALVDQPEVVALGETGLDRYWDYTPFAQQEEFFARHLELSRRTQLPVVIHCREAEADTVRMLRADFEKHGPILGVMHSFTGDEATALACLEMGLYISFAGMVTYKSAQNLRDLVKKIPADRLLVETDSPYLAPVPKRGQRNEPAFVVHTATCLANERGESLESLAAQTSANAYRLFPRLR